MNSNTEFDGTIQYRRRLILIATFLPLCWLGMMIVHEFGHVAGAWTTGATVDRVVLHPLAISRTDVSDNTRPLVVVWAGPLLGIALPLAGWQIGRLRRLPEQFLLRFFAGFCLIANGAYIGVGLFDAVGDAEVMLRHGSPAWILPTFGLLSAVAGLRCWHGLGPDFGFGSNARKVGRRPVAVSAALLLIVVVGEAVCA